LRVHHGPLSTALARGTRRTATGELAADLGLPPDHPTVASLLKANGYLTSLVGKWHLGWRPEFGPNRHGFDEFFGVLSGAVDYFTHRAADASGGNPGEGGGRDLWQDLSPIERVGYLADLLSDQAIEIIGGAGTKSRCFSACNTQHRTRLGKDRKTKPSDTQHTDQGR
jgi:arylsulfatase A-like enzyme